MYLNCKDFSMLTSQTGLPPNQPTSLKVKNVHNFGIFQPIWLKLGMQSLNGRTQHMYLICKDFSMLTGQTSLPPNQPTSLIVKNVHNFGIFLPIWLKFGMQSLNGRTQHMYLNCKDFSMLTGQTGLPPNQPTSRKMKNVHNFCIFQPIWLKLGMQSLNERTQHVYLICSDFSMLTSQTGLPPNQPTILKVKNVHNFGIFQPIWLRKTLDFSNCGFPLIFLW